MTPHRKIPAIVLASILLLPITAAAAKVGPETDGEVAFTADVLAGGSPLKVRFTDLSTLTGADGWLWDFGDGTQSSARHPEHVYVAAGIYDVRLTISHRGGRSTLRRAELMRVDDEVLIEDFEAEGLDSRWDLMGSAARSPDAAISGAWGARFGGVGLGCADCGGDPDIICSNMVHPPGGGSLRLWLDFSQLRMDERSGFQVLQLRDLETGGQREMAIEVRLRNGLLKLRAVHRVAERDRGEQVEATGWLLAGRLDVTMPPVGVRLTWGSVRSSATGETGSLRLEVHNPAVDSSPLLAEAPALQGDLPPLQYVILGVDPSPGTSSLGGVLDADDLEIRRLTEVPMVSP